MDSLRRRRWNDVKENNTKLDVVRLATHLSRHEARINTYMLIDLNLLRYEWTFRGHNGARCLFDFEPFRSGRTPTVEDEMFLEDQQSAATCLLLRSMSPETRRSLLLQLEAARISYVYGSESC